MMRSRSFLAAQLGLLALATHQLSGILTCLDGCYADVGALFGAKVGGLSYPDMRLNSWILAWVQRALVGTPSSLFDANAFHPAAGGLTGSEHMLGVSIPLLPLSPFGPGAVLLHQSATVLSFLIMGWTTFALARWLTRSDWMAFVAAASAMFMPWRIFELAHVQLLSAHWIPLVWLLVGRIMTGQATRWTPVWLALVLFLQLGSSYYLAYYTTASLGVLVLVLAFRFGWHRERWVRLGASLLLAYLPFVLLSLPYLAREADSDLVLMGAANLETSLSDALSVFRGGSPGLADESTRLTYHVPPLLLILAGIGALLGRIRSSDAVHRLVGSFSMALWSIVLLSTIFVLGNRLQVGDLMVDLPGRLASEWIPGFRHLRTPARWSLLVGIAMPLLAAIGLWRGEELLARLAWARRPAVLRAVRVAVVALVLLGMYGRSVPVRPAGLEEAAGPYEALSELPEGPVLEIPWPRSRLREADTGSRYMLASTLHWHPILNGFAPYPPKSYRFLHRLGSGRPSESSLEHLKRLTDLRWIVVHTGQLAPSERGEWERLVSVGFLRRVYADSSVWILELVDREGAGAWLQAITSSEARERTLNGLGRDSIVVAAGSSDLQAEIPETFPRGAAREVFVEVGVALRNGTSRAWPGFDPQTEGLVQLRYRFLASDGTTSAEGIVPLDADVPARGTLRTRGFLQPPEQPGVYRLRLDVVQRLGDGLVELGVPAFQKRVAVRAAGPRRWRPPSNS